MTIPTDRESFLALCYRNLGAPVITVNVAPEQADDKVDQALKLFYERHYNAVEECYILFNITKEISEQPYIELQKDIIGVTDVFRPNGTGNIFDVSFQVQFQLNDLFSGAMAMSNYGDITYYYINKMYMDMLNRFFSPDRQFSFNPISNRLVIAGGLKDAYNLEGGVIIKAYRKIYGETTDASIDDPTNNIVSNIWQDRWLTEYVTALLKFQWAQNMSKFRDLPMMGGVVLNAEALKAEATEELKQLREELDNVYSFPPGFLCG